MKKFTFKIRKYKDGEWIAQCVEFDGIFCGGKKKGRLNYKKDVYPEIRDVLLSVLGVEFKIINK